MLLNSLIKLDVKIYRRLCWGYLLLFVFCVFTWLPICYQWVQWLDVKVFYLLNGSLQSWWWQSIWGLLNHKAEGFYSILIAFSLNCLSIYSAPANMRKRLWVAVLFFWLMFEAFYQFNHMFLLKWLDWHRHSPSLQLSPRVLLSEVLHNNKIKDIAFSSFPSDHAYFIFYWIGLSSFMMPKKIFYAVLPFALFLLMGRVFSGAHWLTDVIAAAPVAMIVLSWSILIWLWLQNKYDNYYDQLKQE